MVEIQGNIVAGARSFVEILQHRAQTAPEEPIYHFLQANELYAPMTCADLDGAARAIAAGLQERVSPGDRVIIALPPGPDFLASFFATLYAGAIAVPVAPAMGARQNRASARLKSIIANAQPSVTIHAVRGGPATYPGAATVEELRSASATFRPPAVELSAVAMLQYTSGSTGEPKGVVVTHGNLLDNSAQIYEAFEHSPESVGVIWLPPYHDMGLIGGILQPMFGGFPVHLMTPMQFLQNPLRWLASISALRATTSGGPNFAFDLCVQKIPIGQRKGLDLSSWKIAFNGAEVIQRETLDRFAEVFRECGFSRKSFRACYGLAEATLMVTSSSYATAEQVIVIDRDALQANNRISPAGDAQRGRVLVNCGCSFGETEVRMVNPETLELCAADEPGEIWLRGQSIAQGYWNNPAATRSQFGAAPAGQTAPEFLRTGDLGFIENGSLYVVGRIKDLIIIRGENFFPEEIEDAAAGVDERLRGHASVAFSVDEAGQETVVFIQELGRTFEKDPDLPSLPQAIRERILSELSLNLFTVVLVREGSIPKTPSGKKQRGPCRELFLRGALAEILRDRGLNPAEPPAVGKAEASKIEEFLLDQIAALTQRTRVGISRSEKLTALGLDSISIIELKDRIEESYQTQCPISALLEAASVSDLAAELQGAAPRQTFWAAAGSQNLEGMPLSEGQRALQFIHEMNPQESAYNIAMCLRFGPALDQAALAAAFEQLLDAHPILKMRVQLDAERIPRFACFDEPHIFVAQETASLDHAHLQEQLVREANRPFDFATEPLSRARLYRSGNDSVLLFVCHHVMVDLRSLEILLVDLKRLYLQDVRSASAASISEKRRGYGDFIQWQKQFLESPLGLGQRNYWSRELSRRVAKLNLPWDYPVFDDQTFAGHAIESVIPAATSAEIRGLCRKSGRTPYSFLMAAFNALLFRFSGEERICIGSPVNGRSQREFANVVGYFVNVLPIISDLETNLPFEELWSAVSQKTRLALENQDFPYARMVQEAGRTSQSNGLFEVMFVFQRPRDQETERYILPGPGDFADWGGLRVDVMPLAQTTSQFDLMLVAVEKAGEFRLSWQSRAGRLGRSMLVRFAQCFQNLLTAIVARPDAPLGALNIVSAEERTELLARSLGPRVDFPPRPSIHSWFERAALQFGDRPAVITATGSLTYRDLREKANQLARALQAQGVNAGATVALMMPRGMEAVIGALGIATAGAAYAPIDPSLPQERIEQLLRATRAQFIIRGRRSESLQAISLPGSEFDLAEWPYEGFSKEGLRDQVDAAKPFYVIGTSGSTGAPKAAVVTHAGFANLLNWFVSEFSINADDRILLISSLSFDLTQKNIYAPLLVGGQLHLYDNTLHDPAEIVKRIAAQKITLLNCTPGAFYPIVERAALAGFAELDSLRCVFLGGEPIVSKRLTEWFSSEHCRAEVVNTYGPTECSDIATFHRLDRTDFRARQSVPIGRPIPNTVAIVATDYGSLCPIGAPGELWVGGAGVGAGYAGDAELTARKFVANDSFPETGCSTLYRTGDLVRLSEDFNLEYLGRRDAQVKLRGYRIELEEIETALTQMPNVAQSAVVLRGEELIGFVIPADIDRPPALEELRATLAQRLPVWMIPRAFITRADFPMSAHGKIDRRALAEVEVELPRTTANYVPPRTDLEQMLVEIWEEALGQKNIGIHDNFFELGGHSLLITRIVSRIRERAAVDLPMSFFFKGPTIAQLALALVETKAKSQGADELGDLLDKLEELSEAELEALLANKQ